MKRGKSRTRKHPESIELPCTVGRTNVETITVPSTFRGERADVVFSNVFPRYTRSQIRKLIERQLILIEGEPLKPSKKLCGGESASLMPPPLEQIESEPQDIPIEIIYQDDDVIVVNKPTGMTVHPGAGIKDGTLVNALLYACKGLSGIGGKIRPGIVHRLDKDTSGVMVAAKNDFSHQSLMNQFKSRKVKKKYIALVIGNIKAQSGSFSSPIGRHPANRLKMTTKVKTGRESLTLWTVVRRYGELTLIEAEPKTGRTHQIRVHFAENGHPLLGDRVYGPKKLGSAFLNELSKSLGRQALHARMIGFVHPKTGEYIEFQANIADDMQKVIGILERR